jgi:hypothetical protein
MKMNTKHLASIGPQRRQFSAFANSTNISCGDPAVAAIDSQNCIPIT